MNSNLPDVHAAADCAVTWNRVVKVFDETATRRGPEPCFRLVALAHSSTARGMSPQNGLGGLLGRP